MGAKKDRESDLGLANFKKMPVKRGNPVSLRCNTGSLEKRDEKMKEEMFHISLTL